MALDHTKHFSRPTILRKSPKLVHADVIYPTLYSVAWNYLQPVNKSEHTLTPGYFFTAPYGARSLHAD
jgi:hypothetical protein